MRIIPAIDIIGGKCVRLEKGDYRLSKTYYDNPLDIAMLFEDHGLQYLHLVDLDGARTGRIINYRIIERIASRTSLEIDFGGGLKSNRDLNIAFESGASKVTGGSIAVDKPEIFLEWLRLYGPGKIILGADSRDMTVRTSGWLNNSRINVVDFISAYRDKGISSVICTDIEKDGDLEGPSLSLYQDLTMIKGISLIASGGVRSVDDLHSLKEIGCEAAIIGKAIYENRIKLNELEKLC